MEDRDKENEFSWSGLFIVTACCSFLFNGMMKLLDGNFSELLFVVGALAVFLAIINWAVRILSRQSNRKRKNNRFAS